MPSCAVGDVDRRDVVQVSAIIFCPSMIVPRFSILCVLLRSEHDGFVTYFLLFVGHLLLSNGLFAIELRRVVYL